MSQFFFSTTLKKEKESKMLKYFLMVLTGESEKGYSLGLILNPEELAALKQKVLTKKQIKRSLTDTEDRLLKLAMGRGHYIDDAPDTKLFADCNSCWWQGIEESKDKLFKITDARKIIAVDKDTKYPEEWIREALEEIGGIERQRVIAHIDQVKEMAKGLENNPELVMNLLKIDPVSFFAPAMKMFEIGKGTVTLRRHLPRLVKLLANTGGRINSEISLLRWNLKEELRKIRKKEKIKKKAKTL